MPEEHNHLILTSWHVPKLRYGAQGQKSEHILHRTKSVESDGIKIFG